MKKIAIIITALAMWLGLGTELFAQQADETTRAERLERREEIRRELEQARAEFHKEVEELRRELDELCEESRRAEFRRDVEEAMLEVEEALTLAAVLMRNAMDQVDVAVSELEDSDGKEVKIRIYRRHQEAEEDTDEGK